MSFETVIGLEVHSQLSTATKAWCSCELTSHAVENSKVCEVCSAQPGTLPALNRKAVEYAVKLGLALNCKINPLSFFDRKNYFYPDLPKGYQITQFETPIAEDGYIEIETPNGLKRIGVQRVQMEEDTGKSSHEGKSSFVNLNRCGAPLLEVVGDADIRTAEEASAYLKKLHSIVTYLEISHGSLQEGHFRCDVNISLRPEGAKEYGTRTETKNLNSFKSVEKVIEVESKRQAGILNSGGAIEQETLGFDVDTTTMKTLRKKSDAHDYRYFPEPDLLPLSVDEKDIEKWKAELPELPTEKKNRFVEKYKIPEYDAVFLTSERSIAKYFEDAVKEYEGKDPKKVSNWIMVELFKLLNEFHLGISKSPVDAKNLASLLNFVEKGVISGKMAKDVFQKMFDQKKSAEKLIDELGLKQISDDGAIKDIIGEVLKNNSSEHERYKAGEKKLFGFFVGQVMKASKGQANPKVANKLLKKMIEEV